MQTLLNSLTAYDYQWRSDAERWKISDEYAPYQDSNGNRILTKDRTTYVDDILRREYELLVARRGMQLTTINERILSLCVRFLTDKATRTCLLLYGTPGTGKTTFMRAMWMVINFLYRNEIDGKNMSTNFVKASELGEVLKRDKDGYKALKSVTCLFIDDLGFNGESEMVNDYGVKARPIEDIIEYRYDRQLMTVCTTNLTAGEIRTKYGERIYSRICESFSMVAVAGTDYRQLR